MSNDIGDDFEPWIIYLGLAVFAVLLGLVLMGLGIGFYHLRKNIRKIKEG